MSRVERIEESDDRRLQQHRETLPNPRKISHTPGLAEGEELTVDEALENEQKRRKT